MKLNLGCGRDIKQGYRNVDIRPGLGVDEVADLSKLPWFWKDGSVDEVLMLDFLEHFPYAQTNVLLQEAWRILKKDGILEVQVPDFQHCARAAMILPPYMCNVCPTTIGEKEPVSLYCPNCQTPLTVIARAAVQRLYGGQDYPGNWHHNAFTMEMLERILIGLGFSNIEELEIDHQYANWNFKLRAHKSEIGWE